MASQNLVPGLGWVNETVTSQNLVPGFGWVNETVASTVYVTRRNVQNDPAVVVHGGLVHRTIGLGGN